MVFSYYKGKGKERKKNCEADIWHGYISSIYVDSDTLNSLTVVDLIISLGPFLFPCKPIMLFFFWASFVFSLIVFITFTNHPKFKAKYARVKNLKK